MAAETCNNNKHPETKTKMARRKISFPPDSVLAAIVQDGDTPELLRILANTEEEVNIEMTNHVGLTALHYGVLSNNMDAVKILLCEGANVNSQDVHGFTPLHTAAACGWVQIVSLLVVFGADVFKTTGQSELPIDLARDISVIRLLSEEMIRILHSETYLKSYIETILWKYLSDCKTVIIKWLQYLSTSLLNLWLRSKHKPE